MSHHSWAYPESTFTNDQVALQAGVTAPELGESLGLARERYGADLALAQPVVTRRAIQDLKFGDLLPEHLARATLAQRLADHKWAAAALARPRVERWPAAR